MNGTPCISDGFHGIDGMGDVPELVPADPSLIQEEHSANALVRLAKQQPGRTPGYD